MVKLGQLTVVQLKRQLEKLGLSTGGVKTELQVRLREALEASGINAEMEEFPEEIIVAGEVKQVSNSEMMELMMKMMQQMKEHAEQTSTELKKNAEQTSTELKKNAEQIFCEFKDLKQELWQLVGITAEAQEKLSKRVDETNRNIQVFNEVYQLENRLDDLSSNRHSLASVRQTGEVKLKPPVFGGTAMFEVFQLQFETTAVANRWGEDEKTAALIVALKGRDATTDS
ncbi:uncharacterized protein LOC119667034 [Teleopsis dalmanni]|uniref:uncharacterized protein LOC119667034 n=1 Tax=Teleopsis dalmanni TaxID=139649 RepID=UPI0018CF4D59|nr:uncharacterized protein LOC119667034 [Teleopsis dalmanni]